MKYFTPDRAKELKLIANSETIDNILKRIEEAACKGDDEIIIGSHTNISQDVIHVLKSQKWDIKIEDRINYTIHW